MTTTSKNGHANGTPSPTTADNDGRDGATGRFAAGNQLGRQFEPGNPGGRGNPSFRRLAAARRAFLEVVGPDEVQALARRLYQDALAGDIDAARLVLAYAVGKP